MRTSLVMIALFASTMAASESRRINAEYPVDLPEHEITVLFMAIESQIPAEIRDVQIAGTRTFEVPISTTLTILAAEVIYEPFVRTEDLERLNAVLCSIDAIDHPGWECWHEERVSIRFEEEDRWVALSHEGGDVPVERLKSYLTRLHQTTDLHVDEYGLIATADIEHFGLFTEDDEVGLSLLLDSGEMLTLVLAQDPASGALMGRRAAQLFILCSDEEGRMKMSWSGCDT